MTNGSIHDITIVTNADKNGMRFIYMSDLRSCARQCCLLAFKGTSINHVAASIGRGDANPHGALSSSLKYPLTPDFSNRRFAYREQHDVY